LFYSELFPVNKNLQLYVLLVSLASENEWHWLVPFRVTASAHEYSGFHTREWQRPLVTHKREWMQPYSLPVLYVSSLYHLCTFQDLYKSYTQHEKKYGDKGGIENVIVSKRKFQYEEVQSNKWCLLISKKYSPRKIVNNLISDVNCTAKRTLGIWFSDEKNVIINLWSFYRA